MNNTTSIDTLQNNFEWNQPQPGRWEARVPFRWKGQQLGFLLVAGEHFLCTPRVMLHNPQDYLEVELYVINEAGEQMTDCFDIFTAIGEEYMFEACMEYLAQVDTCHISQFLAKKAS